jgi:chorismate mutase-like protein
MVNSKPLFFAFTMRQCRSLFPFILLFCVVLLVDFASTTVARAQTATYVEQIKARNTLRVGTTGDYKPFSYRINANSPYIGLDIDMARALAKELGVQLELVPTSWPTLMDDLANGRFDIAMSGVSISGARRKSAMFSASYLRDGKTPVALCANQARFQNLPQIDQANVRVIVNPGGTNERFVRENLQRAQIIVFPDNNHIFDQIVAGKADLMITDAVEARLQQQLHPTLCALHPEAPFNLSEKAYLLPQDTAWKSLVDQWLQPYLAQGQLANDLDTWLRHPWPRPITAASHVEVLRDLMAQRLSFMKDVARHKWNQQSAIEDILREQKIIASLQLQATALGIPAAWAEQFFRAQIEAAKQIQHEYFAQWQTQKQGKFNDVPNLDLVIRPQLDQLTTQILTQLALSWPALIDQDRQANLVKTMRKLNASNLSPTAVNLAIAPLIDGSAK